jgi:hypothetical protein
VTGRAAPLEFPGFIGPPKPVYRRRVIELARAGTRVKPLAVTFGMSEATIDVWHRLDRIVAVNSLGYDRACD